MNTIDIRQKLKDSDIYTSLTRELDPYKESLEQHFFLVDSSPDGIVDILIQYPGRKVKKRELKRINVRSVHWENLYDFAVLPRFRGNPLELKDYTFEKFLIDFKTNKNTDQLFWKQIENVYHGRKIEDFRTGLPGMDSRVFLLTLKWIWLAEDLNYKVNHLLFDAPTRFNHKNKGVGRGRFFAALLLLKSGSFDINDIKKIITLYG